MYCKKIILVLLSVILTILTLSGCGHNDEINIAFFESEFWSSNNTEDYTAPIEMTLTVNGVSYTGSYSKLLYDGNKVFYEYEGEGFTFQVNANDHGFRSLNLGYPELSECTFDSEHSKEIADAIADDYIALNDFQVSEVAEMIGNDHYMHSYVYYREIDGVRTSERVSVQFDCKGNLIHISVSSLGTFDNVKSVYIDKSQINEALEKRVREECKEYGREYIRYEITNTYWVLEMTETDECVLLFWVDIYWKEKGIDRRETQRGMVVTVDYEEY